jgi:hypothetical protein
MRASNYATSRELIVQLGAPQTFTLIRAVMATRKRRATVELDQLYRLLGMVEGGGQITVRYTSTMEDVLTEALENGMITTELLTGATICDSNGRCWLPDMRHSSHFATGLSRLNRAGRKVEGNKLGMAVVTGYTMPSNSVWTYDDGDDDARFKLKSPAEEILASSNDEVLKPLLGTPVRVVLLDDVLSHDCYATCATMVSAGNIAHRITSSRLRIESRGMRYMVEETHVVGWEREE